MFAEDPEASRVVSSGEGPMMPPLSSESEWRTPPLRPQVPELPPELAAKVQMDRPVLTTSSTSHGSESSKRKVEADSPCMSTSAKEWTGVGLRHARNSFRRWSRIIWRVWAPSINVLVFVKRSGPTWT